MSRSTSPFRGALMVAGVSIGASMLGMPVLLGPAGFIPGLLLYLICCVVMCFTGLLYAEACLWYDKEVNILTLTANTLGKGAKFVICLIYLFLFFALTVAYIVGGGEIMVNLFGETLGQTMGSQVFVALLAPVIFIGARAVDRLNVFLMVCLLASFAFFIFTGTKHIVPSHLHHHNYYASFQALPIVLTAFGFQGLVPTLVTYLNRDRMRIRKAIIQGSLLALVTYIIWLGLIMGVLPLEGPGGLEALRLAGKSAVGSLYLITQNKTVFFCAQIFAFSALVTSFLGVVLPLVDFMADGLKVKKDNKGKLGLLALVLLPPLFISMSYPGVFLSALSFSGAYGGSVILGFLPLAIVWVGRRQRNETGKSTLALIGALFFLIVVVLSKALQLG